MEIITYPGFIVAVITSLIGIGQLGFFLGTIVNILTYALLGGTGRLYHRKSTA